MKTADKNQVYLDKSFVKITFNNPSCHGELIMKTKLYEMKKVRIERALKNVIASVELDHELTLKEFCDLDGRIESQLNNIYRYQKWLEKTRDYDDREEIRKTIDFLRADLLAIQIEVNNAYADYIKERRSSNGEKQRQS